MNNEDYRQQRQIAMAMLTETSNKYGHMEKIVSDFNSLVETHGDMNPIAAAILVRVSRSSPGLSFSSATKIFYSLNGECYFPPERLDD